MRKIFLAFIGLMAVAPLALGQAKDFPNRAIKVIVPFTAGSGSDTSARFFGEKMSAILGQTVVVENRPGASGVIAVSAVKSAPADGHTILLASISLMSVNPVTVKDLPYDPLKDLKPIAGLSRGMAAIIGLDEAPTREVCETAGVSLANLNCPGQLVISGEAAAITRACGL